MSEEKPFQDILEVVKLVNGEELVLPRLTIGKIMNVTDAMSELITAAKDKAPAVFDMFSGKGTPGIELAEKIPELIPLLLNQIVKVLSIYVGKDQDWIKNNMDMEDLAAIAVPFFAGITKQANHVLKPLATMLPKVEEKNPSKP